MKHFLLIVFISIPFWVHSQLPPPDWEDLQNRQRLIPYSKIDLASKKIKTDTTYYPFYQGVQMIKIATQLDSYYRPTFFSTEEFSDVSLIFPIYLFRDVKGKIIKKYNLCGREVEYSKLRKIENIEKYETHNFRYKHAQSHESKKYGKLGVYPIYSAEESNNQYKIYCGLIDTNGHVLIEDRLDKIEWKDSIFIISKENKYGIINENYELMTDIIFEEFNFENTHQNLIMVKRNGYAGITDKKGKYVVPPEYSNIEKSKYRPGMYELFDGKYYQFYNPFNKYLSPAKFSTNNVRQRDNQLLIYDNGWIMMDTNGNILCKSENEITEMVNENRFLTMKWKDGYHRKIIDKNGNEIIEKEYYYLNKINPTTLLGAYDVKPDPYLTHGRPSKYVFLDMNGDLKSEEVYDSYEKLTDNYFTVWKNKKSKIVNDRGEQVFFLDFESVGKMNDHYFLVRNNKKTRFLYLGETIRFSDEYDETLGMSEGMLSIKKDNKWSYLDSNFIQAGPFVFESVSRYQNGMASVVLDGKTYVINKKGENIARENYDHHQPLIDGYVKVTLDEKFGLMDANGMLQVPIVYDKMGDLIKGDGHYYLIVQKDNNYGIINEKNEIIHPFIFDKISELSIHVSEEYNRRKGFYAFCTIEKRSIWEYYYFNFDDTKSYMKTGENSTKGFKKVSNIECDNCTGRKFGLKNWSGEIVVPIKYDYINEFKQFTYQVGIIGQGGGVIDTNGKIIIPIAYQYIYDVGYESNLIRVGRHQGPWGLYDYTGKMIADTIYGNFEKPIFDLIPFHANYNYHFIKGKGWEHGPKRMGLMNREGEIIIPAVYDEIRMNNEKKGEIYLRGGTTYAIINKKLEVIEGSLLSESGTVIPSEIKPKTKKEKRKSKRADRKSKKKKKVRYL